MYSFWDSGEPNNKKKGEHCVELRRKPKYLWNDENCRTHYSGYICEEHRKTAQCRSQVDTKRKSIKQNNSQLSTDFAKTKTSVQRLIEESGKNTDDVLQLSKKSSEDIMEKFKKSLNEIALRKPYLEAVVADVGATVNDLVEEAKKQMTEVTEDTRLLIGDVWSDSEQSINNENVIFSQEIDTHNNEVDKVMAN